MDVLWELSLPLSAFGSICYSTCDAAIASGTVLLHKDEDSLEPIPVHSSKHVLILVDYNYKKHSDIVRVLISSL